MYNLCLIYRWIGFHPLGQYLYTGITNTATLQQTNPRVSFIRYYIIFFPYDWISSTFTSTI